MCSACRGVCGQYEYETQGCANGLNRICAACTSSCPVGQYRTGCLSDGRPQCSACPHQNGQPTGDGTCAAGQTWEGCTGDSPGSCSGCIKCTKGKETTGCTGSSAGTCEPCRAGEYKTEGADSLDIRQCQPLGVCPSGFYDAAVDDNGDEVTLQSTGRYVPLNCVGATDCTTGFYETQASKTTGHRERDIECESCQFYWGMSADQQERANYLRDSEETCEFNCGDGLEFIGSTSVPYCKLCDRGFAKIGFDKSGCVLCGPGR